MSKKAETVFKEKVSRDLMRLPNCWYVKIQQVSQRGIPDYLICLNGNFIGLELKTDEIGSKASKLQEWNLEAIGAAGGLGLVVSPRDWYSVLDMFKGMSGIDDDNDPFEMVH